MPLRLTQAKEVYYNGISWPGVGRLKLEDGSLSRESTVEINESLASLPPSLDLAIFYLV